MVKPPSLDQLLSEHKSDKEKAYRLTCDPEYWLRAFHICYSALAYYEYYRSCGCVLASMGGFTLQCFHFTVFTDLSWSKLMFTNSLAVLVDMVLDSSAYLRYCYFCH